MNVIEASTLRCTILRPEYLREGAESDFVIDEKKRIAKDYIPIISSLIAVVSQILEEDSLYLGESIRVTKGMQDL